MVHHTHFFITDQLGLQPGPRKVVEKDDPKIVALLDRLEDALYELLATKMVKPKRR